MQDAPGILNPVSFLQAFVVQSVKLAEQKGCAACDDHFNYIEMLGLTAGGCLEAASRSLLGLHGKLTPENYADVIVHLKNQIGGDFSRADSEPGVIRVENTRCPFGDMVKEAPELCRMTSSVFGGIAARNFGYAKVELQKRIATHDGRCSVCIYLDRETARDKPGDEYHSLNGIVTAKGSRAGITERVSERMYQVLCGESARRKHIKRAERPVIVAESEAMRRALESAEIVGPTLVSVFISGETGVGKEVVSRAIHALSPRCGGPFMAINCGAIPGELIESLLFGHEKGAFTGAYDVHKGVFERAEGGTLFLDEIDALPLHAQAKLLRVLQEGEFERVGGTQMLSADVRLIAASNRNIQNLVAAGGFRSDLYYRLNVVPICIPPLRERREDISGLVLHLLRRLSLRYRRPQKLLSERAWMKVMSYDWPGNVRELENVLERAFLFSCEAVIEDVDIPSAVSEDGMSLSRSVLRNRKRQAAREIEARLLNEALERCGGNVTAVAREFGITPRAIHQKLKGCGINPAAFR